MAEIRPVQIAGNMLGGMQAAQQSRDAQQMNQLRTMQMQQAQGQMQRDEQFRNQLGTYLQGGTNALAQMYATDPERAMQVQTFQAQQNELLRKKQVEEATKAYSQAQGVLLSESPADYFRVLMPDKAQALAQHRGVAVEDLTDDDALALAEQVSTIAAAQAGMLPEFSGPETGQVDGKNVLFQTENISGRARIIQGIGPKQSNEDGAFTLSEGQTRYDAKGKPIASVAKVDDSGLKREQTIFERANTLRDEYDTQSKDFQTATQAYQRVLSSATDPSAAGDLALIFSYMRTLDPGSTVREGEFANAENAGGVEDRVRAQYNKVLRGERLSDDQRSDFVKKAGQLYQGQKDIDKKRRAKYRDLATRADVNPDDVLGEEVTIDVPPNALSPGQSTQVGGFKVTRKR